MTERRVLTVNGRREWVTAEPAERLLDVLGRELGLDGVRETCGVGLCGTCTVLVDGRTISSCLALVGTVDEEAAIETVEGLADGDDLHPIQAAFLAHNAFQCSYCTPGFLLATKALLAEHPDPTVEQVRHGLAGNLCRCGSYSKIVEAVLDAAARLRAADA